MHGCCFEAENYQVNIIIRLFPTSHLHGVLQLGQLHDAYRAYSIISAVSHMQEISGLDSKCTVVDGSPNIISSRDWWPAEVASRSWLCWSYEDGLYQSWRSGLDFWFNALPRCIR